MGESGGQGEKAPQEGFALMSQMSQRISFLEVHERLGLFYPQGIINSVLVGWFKDLQKH